MTSLKHSNHPLECVLILVTSLLTGSISTSEASKSKLIVGAIIEGEGTDVELAFNASIKEARKLLQTDARLWNSEIVPVIERIEFGDTFQASRMACKLLKMGIVAILGPQDPLSANHVRAVCSRYGIPYLETSWGFRQTSYNDSLNLHPYYKSFGQAIKSFVTQAEKWDNLAIIYYSEDSLLKFEDLLNGFERRVMIRQWRKTDGSYKYLMKYLHSSMQLRFLVDIPYWLVRDFLNMASTYNMTTAYYSYVFTDMDVFLVDLSSYKQSQGANLTTFTIAPFSRDNGTSIGVNPHLENLKQSVYKSQQKLRNTEILPALTTSSALVYDAIQLLIHGVMELSQFKQIYPSELECGAEKSWAIGSSITNTIRSKSSSKISGLTGDFYFDSNGWRDNFNLTILEVSLDGYHRFGYWNADYQLTITKQYSQTRKEINSQLNNMTLRVTTVEDVPFVIAIKHDKNGKTLPDPDAWDGFCIALLKEIAHECGFNFTMHPVENNVYGYPNGTKADGSPKFNGMIGELIDHKADLALAPLTITYERERVIDFTTPFMSLGLSIIYRRPKGKKPHLFSFLQPLSPPVWGYVLAAYILVSFVLFVVARFSPYEWYNPHPCNADSDIVENQFNMLNSLWFTIGSLMQQGADMSPRATSTRIVAGIWWFFTLIIISSYTANLAAFLTVERMKSPIENAEDLSKQTRIQYGALRSGSTYSFFQKSTISTYKKMWNYMNTHQSVFTSTTNAGILKVLSENYAFILESTMNEYYRQRNCSLMQVGGLLDSKGYGIGLPQGSRFRDIISVTILKLQKKQRIDTLRQFWWRQFNITKKCAKTEEKSKDANAMEMEQVGGVFVILLFGFVISIFAALIEFYFKTSKRSSSRKRNVCHEISEEMRLAVRSRSSKRLTELGLSKMENQGVPFSCENKNLGREGDEHSFNPCEILSETEGLGAIERRGGTTLYRHKPGVTSDNPVVRGYPRPQGVFTTPQRGGPTQRQRSCSDRNAKGNGYPEFRMKKEMEYPNGILNFSGSDGKDYSPFTAIISEKILELQDKQIIQYIKDRYWRGKMNCSQAASRPQERNEIRMENIGGIFLFMVTGLVSSITIAFFEFVWKVRSFKKMNANGEASTSIGSAICRELYFALRCLTPSKRSSQYLGQEEAVPVTIAPPMRYHSGSSINTRSRSITINQPPRFIDIPEDGLIYA